jgi:hypothetical protein
MMLTQDLTKTLDVDKILDPPDKEVWAIIQSMMRQQKETITTQANQISEYKIAMQRENIMNESGRINPVLNTYKRKEFKPAITSIKE